MDRRGLEVTAYPLAQHQRFAHVEDAALFIQHLVAAVLFGQFVEFVLDAFGEFARHW